MALGVTLLVTLIPGRIVPWPSTGAAHAQETTVEPQETRQELKAQRTVHSKTFLETDGSLTAEIFSEQVHFKDDSGTWSEIDNEIVADEDGSGFTNRAGDWEVDFAASGAASNLVSIADAGKTLLFGIAAGRDVPGSPDGNRIIYEDILPDMDLVYELEAETVKEMLVLKKRPSIPSEHLSFRFPLSSIGLNAVQVGSTVEFRDESDATVFSIPKLFMYDSSVDPHSGDSAFSEDLELTVEQNGNKQFLRVDVDGAWLTDPARVYPVTIDPPVVKDPSLDTFVQSNIYNTPQHASEELKAGTYDYGTTKARSLIRFPLASLNGTVIESADLKLYENWAWSCTATRVDVHRVLQDWTSDVVWDTKPPVSNDPVAHQIAAHGYSSSCPSERVVFNVTDEVRQWVYGTQDNNFGFGIKAADESDVYGWKKFASDNTSNPPKLVVQFNTPPRVPTDLDPPHGTISSNSRPVLSGVYDDADPSDGGHLRFEVRNLNSQQFITSGVGDFAEPGQESSWQIPAYALEGQGWIEWRAAADDGKARGDWSSWKSYKVDGTATTTTPVISSTTHPNQTAWSTSRNASFTWGFVTGALNYAVHWDQNPVSSPANTFPDCCTTTRSFSVAGITDGTWYLHVRARGFSGQWVGETGHYRVNVDWTPSSEPPLTSPTHPDSAQWYADAYPVFEFKTTDIAPIVGYSYVLDQSEGTNPPTDVTPSQEWRVEYSDLDDGTYWFHVRALNASGFWSETARKKINIDADPPLPPQVWSDTHPEGACSARTTASFEFTADDYSGISGFSYVWDRDPSTTPPEQVNNTSGQAAISGLTSGEWWVHVRARNGTGLWGGTRHYRLLIDTSLPPAPTVSSISHQVPGVWYSANDLRFGWGVTAPCAGVTGYSYSLDKNATTEPSGSPQSTTSALYQDRADGIWWFHVRAHNDSGAGATAHFSARVDTMSPLAPASMVSATHMPGLAFQNDEIEVQWTQAIDPPPLGDEASGIDEYWYAFRPEGALGYKGAPPDGSLVKFPHDRTANSGPFPLEAGRYWFHVVAVDRAGNKSSDKVFGPLIIDPDGLPMLPNPTLTQDLVAQSDEMGKERFYPYAIHGLGTSQAFVQLHSGNLVVQRHHATIPGKGLDAILGQVYNAQRDDPAYHDSGLGLGWSLSVAAVSADLATADPGSLAAVAIDAPILIADVDLGNAQPSEPKVTGILELTDGDGTSHRFVRRDDLGGRWEAPPGIDLRVLEIKSNGLIDGYDLIRPDGVRYEIRRVLSAWKVTSIKDREGNVISFEHKRIALAGVTDQLQWPLRLTSISHSSWGVVVTLEYEDKEAHLTAIETLPGGDVRRSLFNVVNTSDRLLGITENSHVAPLEDDRRSLAFAYENGSLKTVSDALDHVTTFEHVVAADEPRVQKVTDRENHDWLYSYDSFDDASQVRITSATTPLGDVTTYRTSPRGPISGADRRIAGANILSIKDAGNNSGPVEETFAWEQNHLVSSTDGAGHETTYNYDDLGSLTKITTPAPNPSSRSDLPAAAPTTRVVTELSYDYNTPHYDTCSQPSSKSGAISELGYCSSVAELRRVKTYTGENQQARVTDLTYHPGGQGRIHQMIARGDQGHEDRVTTLSYHPSGELHTVDGPRAISDVTRFEDYGAHGLPARVIDALSNDASYIFDAYGVMRQQTDREDRTTQYSYDELNRLESITDPLQHVTSFTYDRNGNREATSFPRGDQHIFTYDANGRLETISKPGATQGDPRAVTTLTYRADGLLRFKSGPVAGFQIENLYYPNGSLKEQIRPAGTGDLAVTSYDYDGAGRVIRTTLPWTGQGRPKTEIDYAPNGQAWRYSETSSSGSLDRITRVAYNAHGEQIQVLGPHKVDGVSSEVSLNYSPFGELEERKVLVGGGSSGPARWARYTFAYNTASNLTTATQPTAEGGELTSTYTYDALGRIDAHTKDPFNPDHTVTYSYDKEGNQIERVDREEGTAVRGTVHTYNADYSLRSVVYKNHTSEETLALCNFPPGSPAAGYDAEGNLLITRSVSGTNDCQGGTEVARREYQYDDRGRMKRMVQSVRSPATGETYSREQTFEHRKDGALTASTFGGVRSVFDYSLGGLLELAIDWRNRHSQFTYRPFGGTRTLSLGGVASGLIDHHLDGSMQSLRWTNSANQSPLRSHTSMAYNTAGMLSGETVNLVRPSDGGALGDTAGTALFDYDLGGRLVRWDSPFQLVPSDTSDPKTTYQLDDGANIKVETTRASAGVGEQNRRRVTSTYPHGRLETRTQEVFDITGTRQGQSIDALQYTRLGQEKRRTTDQTGVLSQDRVQTQSYDPAGHHAHVCSALVPLGSTPDGLDPCTTTATGARNVTYVYDAWDRVVARTSRSGSNQPRTTLYFYFGNSNTLAEERDGSGGTFVRYLVTPQQGTIAQQRFAENPDGTRDQSDTSGNWRWLLTDSHGSIGTHVSDAGEVTTQRSYDPYGAIDGGGSSQSTLSNRASSLGFQQALTDSVTGNLLLGPRQYDPSTQRFMTTDWLVSGSMDMALGTDSLTSNRYLFAAGNPVGFYDDGHRPTGVGPSDGKAGPAPPPSDSGTEDEEEIARGFKLAFDLLDAAETSYKQFERLLQGSEARQLQQSEAWGPFVSFWRSASRYSAEPVAKLYRRLLGPLSLYLDYEGYRAEEVEPVEAAARAGAGLAGGAAGARIGSQACGGAPPGARIGCTAVGAVVGAVFGERGVETMFSFPGTPFCGTASPGSMCRVGNGGIPVLLFEKWPVT